MTLLLKSLAYLLLASGLLIVVLIAYSQWQAGRLEVLYPNQGTLTDVGGFKLNSVYLPPTESANLPALVFVHGASGNLLDPMSAFARPLMGRAEMLFVDRPGYGYSERGPEDKTDPGGQADAIAALMDKRGIRKAIVIGHSFGAAIVAALAVNHPDKVQGLLFLSPATHPWPGGVDWYYDLSTIPVVGALFCHTVALPAGMSRMNDGIASVFAPNPVPAFYRDAAAIPLVLRPANFCNNARDVANLLAYVTKNQPRYREISAPTVIITGDSDDIVLEEIHSIGLHRDIAGSELLWVKNLGHKPDHVATDLAIAAIEKIAGQPRDLQNMAHVVETRIAPPARLAFR